MKRIALCVLLVTGACRMGRGVEPAAPRPLLAEAVEQPNVPAGDPNATPAPPADGAPAADVTATAAVAAPPPVDPDEARRWDKARFSGGRLVVEILGGAVLGSLAAYGVYEGLGGEGLGASFAAIGTSFAVTPLIEWGIGRAMGGRGSLGYTYIGGLIGFSASSPAAQNSPGLVLLIAQICLPITSGLFFELTSNGAARRWQIEHGASIAIVPQGDGATLTAAAHW